MTAARLPLLRLLFLVVTRVDLWRASADMRSDALRRAHYALCVYRGQALAHLLSKLADPRRRGSRREIRLAIAFLLREEARQFAR